MSANAQANPFAPPSASLDGGDAAMETEFRLNILSPQGRIGRVRYLLYSIVLTFSVVIAGVVLLSVLLPLKAVALPALALYGVFVYLHIILAIKRSHDFNVSGWLSLLIFVPMISLIFLFVPGTDGPNRFGLKTAPNGRAGVILALVLVGGIFVIGILTAIAIPNYQDYKHRAEAAQHRQR